MSGVEAIRQRRGTAIGRRKQRAPAGKAPAAPAPGISGGPGAEPAAGETQLPASHQIRRISNSAQPGPRSGLECMLIGAFPTILWVPTPPFRSYRTDCTYGFRAPGAPISRTRYPSALARRLSNCTFEIQLLRQKNTQEVFCERGQAIGSISQMGGPRKASWQMLGWPVQKLSVLHISQGTLPYAVFSADPGRLTLLTHFFSSGCPFTQLDVYLSDPGCVPCSEL